MIKKAESMKVQPAWMILTNKHQEFKKKIFINDLLFEIKADSLVKANARRLWLILSNNGFYLHPSLEKQYVNQRVCFFCGGEIVTHKADEGNYEETCSECGYIYLEE